MNLKQAAVALVGGGLVYVALAARVSSSGSASLPANLADPVSPAKADVSGTRLKSKFIAGADGSRLVLPGVLVDSQIGVDCTFRRAADGTLRCLPRDVASGWTGMPFFTDASCTAGVVFVDSPPAGCTAEIPTHVLRFTDPPYCTVVRDDRDMNAHVYAVGALLAPVSAFYRINAQGVCVGPSVPPANVITHAVGAELPAATFAAGTAGTDP